MKSDDVVGRVKTYEAIVKGQNIPKPGIPESFKVLIKELQSLALDIRVLDKDGKEIDLQQDMDDDLIPADASFDEKSMMTEENPEGYQITDENGEYEEPAEDDEDDFFKDEDDSFDMADLMNDVDDN